MKVSSLIEKLQNALVLGEISPSTEVVFAYYHRPVTVMLIEPEKQTIAQRARQEKPELLVVLK